MPLGPQGQKRPADGIGCAIMVARIATGEFIRSVAKDLVATMNQQTISGCYDDEITLLEESNKTFENGEFLSFDESEKFIASILNVAA